MSTVTVTVGMTSRRTLTPLPRALARKFCREVRDLLRTSGCEVYVDGARGRGQWKDMTTGALVDEVSRTWVAEAPHPSAITDSLAVLAERYEQDAIACTVGSTVLVRGDRE
jgi:hypothetical protein